MQEFTEIKLKSEWMGYPKGMILMINSEVAKKLIDRGTAKVKVEKKKKLDSPKVDKMVKDPVRKKRNP